MSFFRIETLTLGASVTLLMFTACGGDMDSAKMSSMGGPAYQVEVEPVQEPSDGSTFTLVSEDPFSTFAADVDTASYDLFRSSLETTGQLPGQDRVRTEEDEHPFAISLSATTHFLDNPRALLRVGIQAMEPPPTERKAANLAFLVDTSGSMQDASKLPLVRRLLTETLEVPCLRLPFPSATESPRSSTT